MSEIERLEALLKKAKNDVERSGSRLRDLPLGASRARRTTLVAKHSTNCEYMDSIDAKLEEAKNDA